MENVDTDPASSDQHVSDAFAKWQGLDSSERKEEQSVYAQLARQLLRADAALVAYDVTQAGLEHWPGDRELRWLMVLALTSAGAAEKANRLAQELNRDNPDDQDIMRQLGRTYWDMAEAAETDGLRQRLWNKARDIFESSFQRSQEPYPGICAAALSLLTEQGERAVELATQVYETCRAIETQGKLSTEAEDYYWTPATLGQASLILGRVTEAIEWYQQAAERANKRFRYVRSTRRTARLLTRHLAAAGELEDEQRQQIEDCFRLPRVVAFVGHMVDQADRPTPRFPADLADAVYNRIAEKLQSYGDVIGYSSAACGSDILFQEAIRNCGGQSRIVLPYNADEFARHSVAFAGEKWMRRFRETIGHSTDVTIVSQYQKLTLGSVSYDYANRVLTGLAMWRAERLDTQFTTMAVWDMKEGDGHGGTATVVKRWRNEQQQNAEIIDIAEILQKHGRTHPEPARRRRSAPSSATKILAMMFVDAQNFSKLTEEQMPAFVEQFLYVIGAKCSVSPNRPVVQESRGDGAYFVFDDVGKAGRFALELNDELKRISWDERGLPGELSVRIALHAGPIYEYICPFSRQLTYTGTHVSRTARIEPITPPGEVYASREFAALASEAAVRDFECDYAGLIRLAKSYGTYPIYHLRLRDHSLINAVHGWTDDRDTEPGLDAD